MRAFGRKTLFTPTQTIPLSQHNSNRAMATVMAPNIIPKPVTGMAEIV